MKIANTIIILVFISIISYLLSPYKWKAVVFNISNKDSILPTPYKLVYSKNLDAYSIKETGNYIEWLACDHMFLEMSFHAPTVCNTLYTKDSAMIKGMFFSDRKMKKKYKTIDFK